MAILFELVVNYGKNRRAAEEACRFTAAYPSLRAGEHVVPLRPPLLYNGRAGIHSAEPYIEMAVDPIAVGYGVDFDRPRLSLTPGELSELGWGLYRLLTHFTGYLVAKVGWESQYFVDVKELRHGWLDEVTRGELPGLVLSDEVRSSFPQSVGFEPFTAGFTWIPYQGEHRGT